MPEHEQFRLMIEAGFHQAAVRLAPSQVAPSERGLEGGRVALAEDLDVVVEPGEPVEELEFGGHLHLAILAELEMTGLDDSHGKSGMGGEPPGGTAGATAQVGIRLRASGQLASGS